MFLPELEGRGGLLEPAGLGTGDILDSYDQWGFAFRGDLSEQTSFALTLDQPWGVNTTYPAVATSGYSGTGANLRSHALSATLLQRMNDNVSFYAGVRGQTIKAEAAFPFGGAIGLGGPYSVVADRAEGVGFLAGAAYEIKRIKARLALTYYSEIESTHGTDETIAGVTTRTETDLKTPQSLNLEFQSGIAPKTLAFGGVRWVDWSEFAISPPLFSGSLGGLPLVEYTEDWITYTGGIGHKFNEVFTLAAIVRYTPASDQELTTLGPVDGRLSIGLAPTLVLGDMSITAGVSWIETGDARNFAGTNFADGSAIGAGVRVGFDF